MPTNPIKVGPRKIGPEQPCFIIAEAGVNHNGSLDMAMSLVDAAYECGADAVKFQTWITDKLIARETPMAAYQQQNLGSQETQYDMLKRFELSQSQFREIKHYTDQKGYLFFSTPDEADSADFLDQLGVPLFKIGSGEVTNLALVQHIASKNKPVILSTGMSSLAEVESAVQVIEQTQNHKLVLLHCVSSYPAEPADCNLRAMDTLRLAFQYPVGFSDHTLGIEVAVAAVARGACVLEKHLTLDKTLPGPDHAASLDVGEFRQMVAAIRDTELAMGSGRKEPTQRERETRLVVQRSVVALREIASGSPIQAEDVILLRASGGIPASRLESVVGHLAKRVIQANTVISPEDID